MPDGQGLSSSAAGIQTVSSPEMQVVTCFNNSEYLDAFEVSPDGTQVVVSLDRQLTCCHSTCRRCREPICTAIWPHGDLR
jgi:hypothetical protein